MKFLKYIRIEDSIAVLLFYFSIRMSSNFYYPIGHNITISRHILALLVLLAFAVVATIYSVRKQIIIDSIKSEIELPRLHLKDEFAIIWENKTQILTVFRDYIPFIVILVSYYSIIKTIPSIKGNDLFRIPSILITFADFIRESIDKHHTIKFLAKLSYNTHFISVPVLAVYMYLLKSKRMFRRLMFAVSVSTIVAILLAKTSKLGTGNISMPVCFTSIILIYATKVSKPVTHFFFPIAVMLLAMDITINIPHLYTTIAGLLNAITSVFISDTVIKLEYKLRRAIFGQF